MKLQSPFDCLKDSGFTIPLLRFNRELSFIVAKLHVSHFIAHNLISIRVFKIGTIISNSESTKSRQL
jgi:hypothetical protein